MREICGLCGLMYAMLKLLTQVSVLDSVPNGVLEKLRALTQYIHAPNNTASLLFYCFDALTFYLILDGYEYIILTSSSRKEKVFKH